MTVQDWLDGYRRAWEGKDAEAAAALFTADAVYQDHPLTEPHLGRDGVRAYWSGVTATQEDVEVRFGRPIVGDDGRHAAVEFWVTMRNAGAEVTLTGILFLRFDVEGLCEELREAWFFAEGRQQPSPRWGR
jgi:SnoaL-like domain